MKTMADLVNDLFRIHRRPDGREYSASEIARKLNGQLDVSTITALRTGKVTNPTRNTLLLLCQCFNVPPSYFFPELAEPAVDDVPQVEQPESLRIALRSSGLTPEDQKYVAGLIAILQRRHKTESESEEQ
jgi:transcriptional regulator with XRE-family HTH domain